MGLEVGTQSLFHLELSMVVVVVARGRDPFLYCVCISGRRGRCGEKNLSCGQEVGSLSCYNC